MLFGSKSRSAPRSERSSAAFARSRRSRRRRGKSIRCSQSTARVASGDPEIRLRAVIAKLPLSSMNKRMGRAGQAALYSRSRLGQGQHVGEAPFGQSAEEGVARELGLRRGGAREAAEEARSL